jgi:hypothetical protein
VTNGTKPEDNPELLQLRSDLANLQTQVQDERIRRAEKYGEYMRNWLALCTFAVTVAFLIAGLLGFRSYTEIDNFRKQLKSDADAVSAKAKDVDAVVRDASELVGGVLPRVQKLESNLGTLESRYDQIEHNTDKLRVDVNRTTSVAQQARLDTSNLQSNLESVIGKIPLILNTPTFGVGAGLSTISGKNFGNSKGRLYAAVQEVFSNTFPSSSVEIQSSSIRSWSDTDISFELSPADQSALQTARRSAQDRQRGAEMCKHSRDFRF